MKRYLISCMSGIVHVRDRLTGEELNISTKNQELQELIMKKFMRKNYNINKSKNCKLITHELTQTYVYKPEYIDVNKNRRLRIWEDINI